MRQHPLYNPHRRLGVAMVLATLAHALLVAMIHFDFHVSAPSREHMAVTLVNSHSSERPDDARLLAQANQQGGGVSGTALPEPHSADFPSEETQGAGEAPLERAKLPRPTARELVRDTLTMAASDIASGGQQSSTPPRHRIQRITVRTRRYRDALYLKSWQEKVEQVGNINYPRVARDRGLSGRLTLLVQIRPDGRVAHKEITRSSGHPILDRAALQIVDQAAPFAPFPAAMREEFDLIEIVRTWNFDSGNRLSTLGH